MPDALDTEAAKTVRVVPAHKELKAHGARIMEQLHLWECEMIGRLVFTELGNPRKHGRGQTAPLLGAQGGHLGGATPEWGLGGCIEVAERRFIGRRGHLTVQNYHCMQ